MTLLILSCWLQSHQSEVHHHPSEKLGISHVLGFALLEPFCWKHREDVLLHSGVAAILGCLWPQLPALSLLEFTVPGRGDRVCMEFLSCHSPVHGSICFPHWKSVEGVMNWLVVWLLIVSPGRAQASSRAVGWPGWHEEHEAHRSIQSWFKPQNWVCVNLVAIVWFQRKHILK